MKKMIQQITIFFWFGFFFLPASGQTSGDYYYYYKDEKVFIEPDYSTISVSIEGENAMEGFNTRLTNGEKLENTTENFYRNILVATDRNGDEYKSERTFYSEINYEGIINAQRYNERLEEIKKMPNVLMVSPGFLINGEKIGLSNNFYVELESEGDLDKLYELADRYNIKILGYNERMPSWFTLSCDKNSKLNSLDAANVFYESGYFKNTEPAFIFNISLNATPPNDPLYDEQWYLNNTGQSGGVNGIDVKAALAWNITKGNGVKVAVVDNGIQMNHPDLQANIFGSGYDAQTLSSPSIVRGDHGTACAGIIGGIQNNSIGISGVSPESELISISIQFGGGGTSAQNIGAGITWAVDNGASVLSNSWGGGSPSSHIDAAILYAFTLGRGGLGTVVVFASGNNNSSTSNYPGNSSSLILNVGGVDRCGIRSGRADVISEGTPCNPWASGSSPGSSYGPTLDVVAGGSVVATTDRTGNDGYVNGNYYMNFGGTSAACPMVAGVAALILSVNPDLNVFEVNNIIEQTAQKTRTDVYTYSTTSSRPNGTWNNKMGYGLVNAYEAVKLALSLYCPEDMSIDFDIASGETYFQSAKNTITASNIINANATAEYDAGVSVTLTTGFHAKKDASFRAFLDGCENKESLAKTGLKDYVYSRENEVDNKQVKKAKEIHLYPNPTDNLIHVESKDTMVRWELNNINDGIRQSSSLNMNQSKEFSIQIGGLPPGAYFLKTFFDDGQFLVKTIIKR